MKHLQAAFFISLAMLFFSCEDNDVNPTEIIGVWYSEEIYVNGELKDDDPNTILSLEENDDYYRNYISGIWSLEQDRLKLIPTGDSNPKPGEHKVINVSDDVLTLEITLLEGEYPWNFKDIPDDEIVTVTEKYRKK